MSKAQEKIIDELIVLRAMQGDRESFDLLVRRWQRKLWRYARLQTNNNDSAWEVMQEAWIAILKNIRKIDDPAWFAAWAYRIVRNKSADHHRSENRQMNLAGTLATQHARNTNPPREDHNESLINAMRSLSLDTQELLTLRYGGDLNIMEIAVILSIPAGTVKSRLHTAREQLRKILEGNPS